MDKISNISTTEEIISVIEFKYNVHIYQNGSNAMPLYDVYYNGHKINPYPMRLGDIEGMLDEFC